MTDLAGAGQKVSTLQVKLSAISFNHDNARVINPVKSPEVKALMRGIRRELGTASVQKAPLLVDDIRQIVSALPTDLRGKRDKAILLVGFAGAFRRSELVGLDVDDIRFNGVKATVTLRRSKTDQEGAGLVTTIPMLDDKAICPVVALREWLDVAGITSGVVFRSIDRWGHAHSERMDGREIARVVKARATTAGMDPRQFAGHSLRAGYVTSGVNAGCDSGELRQTTHHVGERAFDKYIRNAGLSSMRATKRMFGE